MIDLVFILGWLTGIVTGVLILMQVEVIMAHRTRKKDDD